MFNIKNLLILLISITAGFILGNCSKSSTPVTPPEQAGEFVIDEIKAEAVIKTAPSSDTLWCYIPYTVKYHFENIYGICNQFSIAPDSLIGVVVSANVPPYPQLNQVTIIDTLIDKEKLPARDSLNINFNLSGTYLKKVNVNEYKFLKQFSTKVVKKVVVKK